MDVNERYVVVPLNEGVELYFMPDFKGNVYIWCPGYGTISKIETYTTDEIKRMFEINENNAYICIIDYKKVEV